MGFVFTVVCYVDYGLRVVGFDLICLTCIALGGLLVEVVRFDLPLGLFGVVCSCFDLCIRVCCWISFWLRVLVCGLRFW